MGRRVLRPWWPARHRDKWRLSALAGSSWPGQRWICPIRLMERGQHQAAFPLLPAVVFTTKHPPPRTAGCTLVTLQSRLTCGGCGSTWSGLSRCHCSRCHRTFATVTVFDRHQVAARCVDHSQIPARLTEGILFEDTRSGPSRVVRLIGTWQVACESGRLVWHRVGTGGRALCQRSALTGP